MRRAPASDGSTSGRFVRESVWIRPVCTCDWIAQRRQYLALRTLFRGSIQDPAEVVINEHRITVHYRRQANSPYLLSKGFAEDECRLHWLGNRVFLFPEFDSF